MTPAAQLDLVDWIKGHLPSPPVTPVLLRRIEPTHNMARFYRLDIERDLFGTWCLVREWGRIGKAGQRRLESYDAPELAEAELARLCAAKTRRGYVRETLL